MRIIAAAIFMIVFSCQQSGEQSQEREIVQQKILTDRDIEDDSITSLRIKRNEIFARYGYKFKSAELKQHFLETDWYTPQYDNVDSLLTQTDLTNIQFLLKREKELKLEIAWWPALHGVWIKRSYYDGIRSGQTPFALREFHDGLAELHFQGPLEDTIMVSASFNNHEASGFYIYPTNNPQYFISHLDLNLTGSNEFHFEVDLEGIDTVLTVIDMNTSKNSQERIKYVKVIDRVGPNIRFADHGISYHTHSIFQGRYKLSSSRTNDTDTVTFEKSGEMVGFNGYGSYEVVTDFGGSFSDTDLMYLKRNDSEYDTYGYRLTSRGIDLYSTKPDSTGWGITIDNRQFQLVKID